MWEQTREELLDLHKAGRRKRAEEMGRGKEIRGLRKRAVENLWLWMRGA